MQGMGARTHSSVPSLSRPTPPASPAAITGRLARRRPLGQRAFQPGSVGSRALPRVTQPVSCTLLKRFPPSAKAEEQASLVSGALGRGF